VVCLLPPAVRARGVQCDAVSLGDCQRAAARGEDALGVEGLQIALAELGARTEFQPTHDITDTSELFHSITVDYLAIFGVSGLGPSDLRPSKRCV